MYTFESLDLIKYEYFSLNNGLKKKYCLQRKVEKIKTELSKKKLKERLFSLKNVDILLLIFCVYSALFYPQVH